MAKKKKSNSVGRFGARYGVRIRRRVREIETRQRQKHRCPQCGYKKVKRESAGIWRCRKCDHKFAGGAYVPETPGFKASQRQLKEALARDEDEFADVEDDGSPGVLDESETVAPGEAEVPGAAADEPGSESEGPGAATPDEIEGAAPESEGPGAATPDEVEGAAPEELTPEERVFDEPAPESEGPGVGSESEADEPASESEGPGVGSEGGTDEPAPEELIPEEDLDEEET